MEKIHKLLLISSILLTLCAFANAQSELVRVLYKNGGSLVGTLVSMDGTSSVIVKIAGVETTIPMEEVQSVEPFSSAETPSPKGEVTTNEQKELSDKYGDFVITDNSTDLPETFSITIDGQEIRMVLVRGGIFNMGYDDRYSQSMKSEPVHRVELSSYYASDNFVVPYKTRWKKAKRIVDRIAEEQSAPYRLLTEAEWEYAAILPVQELVFGKTYQKELKMISNFQTHINDAEWCQDFYGGYTAQRQVNPTGPKKKEGKRHVMRVYSKEFAKWWRIHAGHKGHVRLAISADKIPTQ